jgi:hypothetical protein
MPFTNCSTAWGRGKRSDELPKDLRFKQDRLRKIKEAMKSLEQQAKWGYLSSQRESEER